MEIWGGNCAADAAVSTPGLDLWVYSRPFEGSADGGDVHYVSLCGGGKITRFMLADVSGHGAMVADLARSLRNLMRRNINRKSQERLVKELNRSFGELAKLRRFATAVVATYLTKGDRLAVCNAGHPRPLWFDSAAGAWSFLSASEVASREALTNLPLGIDDTTCYDQTEVVLSRGDLVLFYTDALTEASNAEGKLLGESGLLESVRSLDVTEPRALAGALIRRIDDFRGGKPADDDLTFLLLHHNAGGPPRLTLRESLNVYAKVLHLKGV
jgi:serine phosphatase RsbU (regulator of sigma subunit)